MEVLPNVLSDKCTLTKQPLINLDSAQGLRQQK